MTEQLTKAQREWLERLAKETWTIVDVSSGGGAQCINRLKNRGLVKTEHKDNWHDSYYVVTPAGHAALAA